MVFGGIGAGLDSMNKKIERSSQAQEQYRKMMEEQNGQNPQNQQNMMPGMQ